MSKLQIILLSIIALVLLVLTLTTWGSVGSILCIFCLIIMVSALLYRKLVLERDDDDFKMELKENPLGQFT